MSNSTICRIGLKYCGGCNPNYDRVLLVEELARHLEGKVQFVSPASEGICGVLAVQGCEKACADLKDFEGLDIRMITCRQDAERVIGELISLCEQQGHC